MGARILFALLVVVATPPVKSWPSASAFTAFAQLAPAPKGFADSPRPFRVARMHMTESASAEHLLKRVEPEYPHEARASGLEGDVIFRIIIGQTINGKNGKIKDIHLRRGNPLLIEAAARALSEWQYRAFIFDGEAVEVETFATIRFRLSVGKLIPFRSR
jgi:hypothetical protein